MAAPWSQTNRKVFQLLDSRETTRGRGYWAQSSKSALGLMSRCWDMFLFQQHFRLQAQFPQCCTLEPTLGFGLFHTKKKKTTGMLHHSDFKIAAGLTCFCCVCVLFTVHWGDSGLQQDRDQIIPSALNPWSGRGTVGKHRGGPNMLQMFGVNNLQPKMSKVFLKVPKVWVYFLIYNCCCLTFKYTECSSKNKVSVLKTTSSLCLWYKFCYKVH